MASAPILINNADTRVKAMNVLVTRAINKCVYVRECVYSIWEPPIRFRGPGKNRTKALLDYSLTLLGRKPSINEGIRHRCVALDQINFRWENILYHWSRTFTNHCGHIYIYSCFWSFTSYAVYIFQSVMYLLNYMYASNVTYLKQKKRYFS